MELGAGEVSVSIINGLEFAAINGNQGVGEQSQLLADYDELSADTRYCFSKLAEKFQIRFRPEPHRSFSCLPVLIGEENLLITLPGNELLKLGRR